MEKLLELEQAYFNLGKTSFKFSDEDISSNVELNNDVHYEISKYLGKIGGLLNKYLRKKWLESGIYVDYDHIATEKFPNHLIENVSKIRISRYLPEKKISAKLREAYICYPNFSGPYYHKFVKFLKGLDHVILGDDLSPNLTNELDHDKISVCVDKDSKIIKYRDYKDMKSKYIDRSIIKVLEFGGPFDDLPEAQYPILFSDMCYAYIYLSTGIKTSVPKIKFIVAIDDNIQNIDYYLNIIKPLYDELGIETVLDIFGRSINDVNLRSRNTINLYFGLISTEKNLKNLISDDIEYYIFKNDK